MQTASDILQVLESWAAEKRPIDPQAYIDAAMKLTLLLGDESDKLYEFEQNCAIERVKLIDDGKSVSESKARLEASDEFKKARSQKAKIERMIETVRLAKLRARMANEEMRAQ